jgi:hypothetical protein
MEVKEAWEETTLILDKVNPVKELTQRKKVGMNRTQKVVAEKRQAKEKFQVIYQGQTNLWKQCLSLQMIQRKNPVGMFKKLLELILWN